jgi:DNA polymerase
MDARTELAEILAQTRDYLAALRDDGVTSLEISIPAAAPAAVPAAPPSEDPAAALGRIAEAAAGCRRCGLHKTRKQAVPGQGNPRPELMFIGEAPGADEDEQGLAFVGAAGQLLTQMIAAMGFDRKDVFIANVVKCRPPDNRTPMPDETAACWPFLKEQIAILKPRVMVALGAVAARTILDPDAAITRIRGQWRQFDGIDVMPTYHPSYLLRTPSAKREAWIDLQEVCRRLGRTPPPVGKARKDAP